MSNGAQVSLMGRVDRSVNGHHWGWLALIIATLLMLSVRDGAPWMMAFPAAWAIPIAPAIDTGMAWLVETAGGFFRGVTAALDIPMRAVRETLNWLPWSVIMFVVVAVTWAVAGWKLSLFAALALGYMLAVGLWTESMNSLALVAMSVPLAIAVGFAFGALGFLQPRLERVILRMLDLLQTVPAFAYLLPILLLFGLGPVVGLIASVLYAFPPMVRNTLLGLRNVPPEVVESGLMSGATNAQLFWLVRVPSALRQILLGINQTTMAAFSMVIIASIIGGSADIGWEVLLAIRKALFGESLVAGLVIALMAMVMDRVTSALAHKDGDRAGAGDVSFYARHKTLVVTAAGGLLIYGLSLALPVLAVFPEHWQLDIAGVLNQGLETFMAAPVPLSEAATVGSVLGEVKTNLLFFLMLPLKLGLEKVVTPFSWGFEFTMERKLIYLALAVSATGLTWWRTGVGTAIVVTLFAIVFYFGLTRLPWPAVVAMLTLVGWQLGGVRLAMTVLSGLAFLLLAGIWPQTMLSIYLCGLAVVLSFLLGTTLGVLAAEFAAVSRLLRPFNDTLQTMPLFVILIPFVMIFKIGEFTALLAVMAYATVPAIRYAEHGLRNVPESVIEAATSLGCTRWQLLWRVRMPLALPVIMLGLNQTIMFGIAMLVIAALVGTNGLGQLVYIGLADGEAGLGIVAGLGMALVAIVADRLTQAWSKRKQTELGLNA
ncbi:MAG: ABC transporter permease subunit [Pseudomonadota bacterium]